MQALGDNKIESKEILFSHKCLLNAHCIHILKVFRMTTLLFRHPTYPTQQYQVWSAIDTPGRFIPSLTHGRTHARYRQLIVAFLPQVQNRHFTSQLLGQDKSSGGDPKLYPIPHSSLMVRAECVLCPWLQAETQVATINGIFMSQTNMVWDIYYYQFGVSVYLLLTL